MSAFREHITTTEGNFRTDFFNDTRFDDCQKIKPEVLSWLANVSKDDYRAGKPRPILQNMLAVSANRPTAREVLSQFLDVSLTVKFTSLPR